MTEPVALYGANAGGLAAFSEPLRPALHYVASHGSTEPATTLTHFLASLVHPDFVCNLALLDRLPVDARDAMLIAFEYCLTQGLTMDEQGAILAWLQPYLARLPGAPATH